MELTLRIPPPPPPAGPAPALWTRQEDFLKALIATQDKDDGRYLAWDEVRFRTPPPGLSPEQWWSVIRFRRRGASRALDLLRDVDDRPFSYVLADPVLDGVDRVTRGASGSISISAEVTNTATRNRYVVSSLIEEAITSSQLEGASTSRRVAKEMIKSGRPPKTRSERMILNNYLAMQRIGELRDEAITPDLVLELHRILVDGTLDNPNAAGRLETGDVDRVSVWSDTGDLLHTPPPAAQLPKRLERLCDFANGNDSGRYLPAPLRAIAVHFMVGYDHYFEDGNGRTARALFYWVMLREGFWLTEFITISKLLKAAPAKYARSFLLTEHDDLDLTHFLVYHLGIINRAISALHEHLAAKADEHNRMQAKVAGRYDEFNHRQLALLEHALRNPDSIYTAHSHALSHHVSGETARKDLSALAARGLLVQTKQGKHYAWVPASDLTSRIDS